MFGCAALLAVALDACSPRAGVHPRAIARATVPPRRIVALVPSMTEDLFAIGAGSRVVGVSEFTDYPPAAKRLPVVATFASVDAERIVALRADLAVGIPPQARQANDLRRAHVRTLLLPDDTYDDIFADLRTLGTATDHERDASALIARLRARTASLVRSVPRRARRPSVFVVLGTAPVFTVGNGSYIAALIAMAGGRNAADDVRAPYARYSAEALVARQPDLLVVDPSVRLDAVLSRAPWSVLRAVRAHHVYTLPDAAILERPGPRYNDGLAWLMTAIASAARS